MGTDHADDVDVDRDTAVVFGPDGSSTVLAASVLYDDPDTDAEFILARIDASASPGNNNQSPNASSTSRFGTSFSFLSRLVSPRSNSSSALDNGENTASVQTADADEVDWDFWGKVMTNYEDIARKQPKLLTKKLQLGIPDAIRGSVWQFMSKGKSLELEATYRALLTRPSEHEKVIMRDLARTFPSHEHFKDPNGPGQESLLHVLKAYSVWDPEVGYCQGIAFITGPLLLNMPDEEAFCVLDKLMRSYNFRELYTPTMVGLQLRLYQFDKLLKEILPTVYSHLEAHEVKSNMYASQWFLTLFAYRFPLEIVLRIMDIIFAQGIEATFKFAFALLKKNQQVILATTDLEKLLQTLQNTLFEPYANNANALIRDAAAVHISKARIDRLAADFTIELSKSRPDLLSPEALRSENRRLHDSLRKLEDQYENLNREHIRLVRLNIETTLEKERAEQLVEESQTTLHGLKAVLSSERRVAEMEVQSEMDLLAKKNFNLTQQNGDLLEMIDRLESLLMKRESRINELEQTVKTLKLAKAR
ncbi:GTPase-activating protein [Entophlyctis luteolus]|nr:GTPase-activating protein [Entophlyctis luteolus]KAJ3346194.1 GTPase-activating protein [Entophlyctis luteolus]KAJ3385313.1 GTPase-activating protein [Entophlyctis sp. JEL0112]